jgi:hypothetical protein
MLSSAGFSNQSRFSSRREDERAREFPFKRMVDSQFSICESVKMTIYKGRIAYISTYNMEIFNGPDILKKMEEKREAEAENVVVTRAIGEVEVQTEEDDLSRLVHSQIKQPTKLTGSLSPPNSMSGDESKRKKSCIKNIQFAIY